MPDQALSSTTLALGDRRRIAASHFAFLRGWVHGLPLAELGERYLASGLDLRVVKSELKWLRTELIAMAARSPRPELAALLRRSPRSDTDAATAAPTLPTLDEFAARFPDGFYSQAELEALFSEEFTARLTPAQRRRNRLAARQLDALSYLEPVVTVPPQPDDGVSAWFAPNLAARLTQAGLRRLSDIQGVYRSRGARWWTLVPRLGAKGAAAIAHWWALHSYSLGELQAFRRDASAHIQVPQPAVAKPSDDRAFGDALSPLEHLHIPALLSGRDGSNRQSKERCKLAADNDYDAILAWLSTRPTGSATWRSYRKEAERFLLWAIVAKRKAFSSLNTEDCIVYRDFLQDPQPSERWIGPPAAPRWSLQWRPFCGPLSRSSTQHAQTVLRLLCEWLTRQRYLDSSPWDGVPMIAAQRIRIQTSRAFTAAQWETVRKGLTNLSPSPTHRRLQFMVSFLYSTGLRLSELASARLRQLEYDADTGGWSLHVLGKGLVAREIPLASDTVEQLRDNLMQSYPEAHLDIDPSLEALIERLDLDTALIRTIDPRRDPEQPVSHSTVYKALKAFFSAIANGDSLTNARERKRFVDASTHWLRHTFASHALADGMSLDVVRDVLGHASIATTSLYLSAERKRKAEQMQQLVHARATRRSPPSYGRI
ncbi:MAG: tyrosine-type recombinase/integrase [Casimicrobium sp.]